MGGPDADEEGSTDPKPGAGQADGGNGVFGDPSGGIKVVGSD